MGYEYSQGDIVNWRIPGVLSGQGIVVGIANEGVAVLGVSYIVQDISCAVPTDHYPYTHVVVPELHLSRA